MTAGKADHSISRYVAIALLLLVVSVITVAYALSRPQFDFMEYWTAAHLLLGGKNPYSLGEVFRVERELGLTGPVPLMLLSPPLILPFIAPLGFASSYPLAWLLWVAAMTIATGISSWMLMDVYFGNVKLREISDTPLYRSLFAFTFFPVLLCLRFAQSVPLILFGLAGFIYFETRKKPFLAGVFLSLTLIKPHLTYLVWLAVLLWSFQQRRWKLLASAVGAATFLTSVGLLLDHRAIGQYLELTRSPYMQAYAAGIASLFRKLTSGLGTFWIQLVPTVIGVIWFAQYWRRRNRIWSWSEELPMVVTVSVFTSAYGWHFDQMLLVLAVIAVAGKRAAALGHLPRKLVISYTVLNCILMLTWPLPTVALLPAPIFLVILLWRERGQRLAPAAMQLA